MARARIAINGFGRIGRLAFRQLFGNENVEIVAVNDLGDLENLAYLLQYDTVYHRYARAVTVDAGTHAIVVDGTAIQVLQEKDPAKLPWAALQADIVIESTGFFDTYAASKAHLTAGAKRVIITGPTKDAEGVEGGRTILMGVNEDVITTAPITSNGSCTTNASSPVMQILSENPGIVKAMLTSVHANTNAQAVVDTPVRSGKNFRGGRAASQNIIPYFTGATVSLARAVTSLQGIFDGLEFRVPIVTGSVADITFVAKRPVTVEEVNDILRKAAAEPRWHGIFTVTDDQIVSSDVIGAPYGSIADLSFTKVVGGDLVKVVAWYDNEWGYTTTLVKHVEAAARSLQ